MEPWQPRKRARRTADSPETVTAVVPRKPIARNIQAELVKGEDGKGKFTADRVLSDVQPTAAAHQDWFDPCNRHKVRPMTLYSHLLPCGCGRGQQHPSGEQVAQVKAVLRNAPAATQPPACREEECRVLETFLRRSLSARESGSIYISGIPGTGVEARLSTNDEDQMPHCSTLCWHRHLWLSHLPCLCAAQGRLFL